MIITTHAFIDQSGARPTSAVHRPDGLSAATVWNQLIVPNCNIDIILNATPSAEKAEFQRIRKEVGLKAALAWRDARFSDGKS